MSLCLHKYAPQDAIIHSKGSPLGEEVESTTFFDIYKYFEHFFSIICVCEKNVVPLHRILKSDFEIAEFTRSDCSFVMWMPDRAYIRHILSIYSAYIGRRWKTGGENGNCPKTEGPCREVDSGRKTRKNGSG